ncbi:MAG TPA: hypothetical protein VJC39_02620 [Candidatus Nanoarchaeia archaeon]|nr:hypothetical protein [Candidatus Nanoarchaeia archaeon]
MKKNYGYTPKIGLIITFLIVILTLTACQKQIPPTVDVAAESPVDIESKIITAEPEEIESAIELEKTEPKTTQLQLFDPTITYTGAYNGPLYATSEQVGSASMNSFFKNLDRNGINYFIGFFGISGEPSPETLTSDQGLGEVIDAVQKHPYRVIPFFNPGIGGEEIEQKGYLKTDLINWYKSTLSASQKIVGKNFIKGIGEIETQEWSARHNDPKIIELVQWANNQAINFMFHPVASKFGDVEKIIEAYPNTIFLIHMYREDLEKSKSELIRVLKEHNNLYFSIDAAHIIHIEGDAIYDLDSSDKESSIKKFVSYYDSKENTLINNAIKAYKPLVDAAPDKVMWGTEIGPEYAFDPQVFDRAIKASRMVIAGFNKEHQEAVGYKNALRVFGEGVAVESSIKIINTGSWPDCSNTQMSDCDGSCEIPDSDILTTEQEACFHSCLNEKKCTEVVEQDIG